MVATLDGVGAADPGRLHAEGLAARHALEQARATIAAGLGGRPREVVLTSGTTESIASVLWGAAERGGHLLLSAVEHSALRIGAARLAETGSHQVTTVGVDHLGRVDPEAVRAALRADTALVAVQWANHEVGTRQPVHEIVAACREHGALSLVDATAAAGHDDLDFAALGADLLLAGSPEMGGPAGIGVLCIRRGLRLRPLLVGGDQERARRAGLENVAAAAGLAAVFAELATVEPTPAIDPADPAPAAAGAHTRRALEDARQRRLTERLAAVARTVDGVTRFGDPHDRLAHVVCLGIDGVEPQGVLLGLDQAGIAAHSGSACSTEELEPSAVLAAMGVDAQRSLRLSVGWSSTDDDVDAVERVLPAVVDRLRSLTTRG